MLGEQIGGETGKVTSRRVLPSDGHPRMEVSFESTGTILGVEARNTGTYWSVMRPDGTLYGEGQGIVMGKAGEAATWKGQGIGRIGKDGSVSYRGALYYQTLTEKLSRLNSVAGVFEFEVAADGSTRSKLWEWK